jgi:hypothetical protein
LSSTAIFAACSRQGQRRQRLGHVPGEVARRAEAEVGDLVVALVADHPGDEADERRHLRQLGHHGVDQAAEQGVDAQEVAAQRRQLVARAGARCGDAEVEVDVGVHAQQQVLEDDRLRALRGGEGDLPAGAARLAGLPRPPARRGSGWRR